MDWFAYSSISVSRVGADRGKTQQQKKERLAAASQTFQIQSVERLR